MPLHPAFRTYLDELAPLVAQAERDGVAPTPASARAALAGLRAYSAPDAPVALVRDGSAAGVPVRVYAPAPGEERDAVLFVHGGGHVAGDLDVYDGSARRTAAASGMTVVSVDYRRAPEWPYPAGLDDTAAVLNRLEEALVGIPWSGRVHAVADSGGAAKVASLAMRAAAERRTCAIERQVLIYPSLDYTMSGATMTEFGAGYFLSAQRVAWYFDQYFPAGVDRTEASPVSGPFSADMPETLVIAAEYDPLRSEAEEYVRRARDAGARVSLVVATGMIHAFAFFETLVPRDVARLYEVTANFLADGAVPTRW